MSAADVLAGRAQWAIEQGDVLDRLAALPDESVNCVVTSPPYWGLRDYGTASWEGGDPDCAHAVRTAATVVKQRASSGLEGSKETVGHQREGYSTTCARCGATRVDQQIGLEPTPDAYVARMVAVFADVRRVLRSDGCCWINLGDSYYGATGQTGRNDGGRPEKGRGWAEYDIERTRIVREPVGLKPKDLIGIPWRVAFALQADGWWLRSDVIWAKPNPMPESVTDRPTRSHEYLFLLTKNARYWYDADAIREPSENDGKPMKMADGWDTGAGGHGAFHRNGRQAGEYVGAVVDGRNKRTVWTIATEPYPNAHFATMPTALVEPCILAGCPVGGVVLDPFVGSGTVVLEALRHGRRGIGIDLSPAYVAMARRRVEGDCPMFNTEAAG